jgi:hypothetical protein
MQLFLTILALQLLLIKDNLFADRDLAVISAASAVEGAAEAFALVAVGTALPNRFARVHVVEAVVVAIDRLAAQNKRWK